MRHSGGGPYGPQNSAKTTARAFVMHWFFVSVHINLRLYWLFLLGKKKSRIWVLMMMTLPEPPLLSKLQIESNIISKYLCTFMIGSSNEFELHVRHFNRKLCLCVLKFYLTDHPKGKRRKLIYKHTLLSPTHRPEQHKDTPNLQHEELTQQWHKLFRTLQGFWLPLHVFPSPQKASSSLRYLHN